jgi:transcriptional regulator GlxA family with amidase domain
VQVLILEIARDALRSKDLHRENSLPGKIKTLQHVFSFMGSVFKNPPPVSDIARNAGMSTEHFIRTFKAETGLTPADYMRQKRMELASQLLLKTDLSIKELAFECGYRDPVYFSKVFKSYYRQSPTDYRNSFC